ncbi:hypothetical protein ACIQC9_13505 [Brevundimonas sp. NPDC092305]|uniref:hypothetical protein n=1 Tax=Brevundimonas sp. NPDC092305 TaxID=3363957 RepID=UPI0037F61E24
MRLTVLALIAAASLAGCGQPAEKAPAEPAAPAAAPAPEMPVDAPPQEEVATPVTEGSIRSCLDERGAEASAKLVERCRAVSPATHPPCNAANDCATIQGEIDRACALWERDGNPPAECAA